MARRSPTTTLSATAALALLALAGCGDPGAPPQPTGGSTSQVSVSPGGLAVGGVDGQVGVAAPGRKVDG